MSDDYYPEWMDRDTNDASRSFLTVHRAHELCPLRAAREFSEWYHSLLPGVEDQETPHELPIVLTLRCSPRPGGEGHKSEPLLASRSKNITASQIRAAQRALNAKNVPIQGRKADFVIMDDLDANLQGSRIRPEIIEATKRLIEKC